MKFKLWSLFSAVFFLISSPQAQTPDTSVVRGQVLDQSRAAVTAAEVILTNGQTGLKRMAMTNVSGEFVIAGVPILGQYELTAEKAGFAKGQLTKIHLTSGSTATFNIILKAGAENTEITVTGTAGEVRTDMPQLGIQLSETQIQEMPLLNRRITNLPLLNAANRPTISTGDIFTNQTLFTTNGAGRRQAWFEVDGGNGIDMWGRQTIHTNLPLGSIAEMTVLSNAFSAEYGHGVGSVVNIVTKGGTNNYHGSLGFNWRPSATSANLSGFTPTTATSGAQIIGDNLKQLDATFGGPIGGGGKTHFFLNGEYSWQNRVSPITSPVAPGSFVGKYRGWLGDARFDHQINENNTTFLRLSADAFGDSNPAGGVGGNTLISAGRAFSRRTYTAAMGETAVLNPSLLNNFRAQFELGSPITAFKPFIYSTQSSVPIAGVGTFTSGTSQAAKLQNRQFEFSDTLAWMTGRHSLKFGGALIRAHSGGNGKEFGGPNYLGTLTYKTCPTTMTVTACQTTYLTSVSNLQSYSQSFGIGSYTVDDTLWSLFVQDDFRATRNLTLNAGLRYERQTFTDSTRNFAPRIGFAYNLFGDGKTVLRGGYGIYYSQIPDNQQANYALGGPTGIFTFSASSGQIGFPTSISSVPYASFPTGGAVPVRTIYIRPGMASYYDQFLPTSTLKGYPDGLWSPYSQQWTFGIDREIASNWVLSLDYVGSHTIKVNRPLDVDSPTSFIRTAQGQSRTPQTANCTRPFWTWWYQQNGSTCNPAGATNPQPPYAVVTSDVNNGYGFYNALNVNLRHRLTRHAEMLASYTWSHALNNVDPDIPQQNPNDPNFTGPEEYGDAIFDQRHRLVVSGVYEAPFKIHLGGIATYGSGLPFNITTGTANSGDTGATTDRPVVNGSVLRRNAGRGRNMYDVSPFVERPFQIVPERLSLNLRVEAFNVLNHPNFVGYIGTYGNGTAPVNLGKPNPTGINSQLPARSFQFSARLQF